MNWIPLHEQIADSLLGEDLRTGHLGYEGTVFVYYNLHKKVWSLKKGISGPVIGHTDTVKLRDAKFHVQKGGKERVRREKAKNVHAGVLGKLVSTDPSEVKAGDGTPVTYNPYKYDSFVSLPDEKPVSGAAEVTMVSKKVWAKGVKR